jgi:predicted nucleic acid-binding protein
LIRNRTLELVWSYILDFENNQNPFSDRRKSIAAWKPLSIIDMHESASILEKAENLFQSGIAVADALHIAAAIEGNADYFFTTDYSLIKKTKYINEIQIMNPVQFFIEKGTL